MADILAAGDEIQTRIGVAIAIPARDEADRLAYCLRALARQRISPTLSRQLAVVVTANNCTDATAQVARGLTTEMPYHLVVREVQLPSAIAHAGGARGSAMAAAASVLGADGILLTTDADAIPGQHWLAANVAAIDGGADAVAGAIAFDELEFAELPRVLRASLRCEVEYGRILDRLASLVDPEAHDPWPRHHWEAGASMALTRRAWRQIGGLPRVAVGEDRALFTAVRRAGFTVRHAPEARVNVSCRLDGRAVAGMAETLTRRMTSQAPLADDRLEPATQALFRFRCRSRLRRLWACPSDAATFAADLGLSARAMERVLASGCFSAGWEMVEAESRLLQRDPMPLHALAAETRTAQRIIAALKSGHVEDRGGIGCADRAAVDAPAARVPL